jgi:hypothetical protein
VGDWHQTARTILEDACAATFGSVWDLLPDGEVTPIRIVDATLDDFGQTQQQETLEESVAFTVRKVLEVRRSLGVSNATFPGGESSVAGTATRLDPDTLAVIDTWQIVATDEDSNNLFLYLSGPIPE